MITKIDAITTKLEDLQPILDNYDKEMTQLRDIIIKKRERSDKLYDEGLKKKFDLNYTAVVTEFEESRKLNKEIRDLEDELANLIIRDNKFRRENRVNDLMREKEVLENQFTCSCMIL